MKLPKGRHLLVLAAMCALMAASVGVLINVAGVFFSPIAEELGCGRGAVSLTATISNIVFALAGVVAGRLLTSKSFKGLLVAGAGITVASTAGLAFAGSLPVFYVLNALRGLGSGLAGMVVVTTVMGKWFSSGAGLLTSLAMCTSGIAGALLSPVLSSLVGAVGWRFTYVIAAVICAVLFAPMLLPGVTLTPEEQGLEPFGGAPEKDVAASQASTSAKRTLPAAALMLALAFAFCSSFAGALPQHFLGISEALGLTASIGAGMLSASMITNSAGKLALGALIDAIGAFRSILIWLVAAAAGVLGLALLPAGPVMLACAALVGLAYSFTTVALVFVTTEIFGAENYTSTYPIISLSGTVANALATAAIGFLYDLFGTYNVAIFLIAGLLVAAGAALVILYRRYVSNS